MAHKGDQRARSRAEDAATIQHRSNPSQAGDTRRPTETQPDAAAEPEVTIDSQPKSPGRPGLAADELGGYEILQEIARGGMGVVYKARHQRLGRTVALKMILSGQLASEEEVRRFYAEAEAAAKLDHPGIVPIYEVGQHESQHYFTMGFVDGTSLAARVAEGPMAGREAAQLVQQLAVAVNYAHEHGIVHRDLKPHNVLLSRDGQPRITDFGLAKATHTDSSLTASGQVLGTPSYMPPEQARGERESIGPATDVYSLGAILYCLITGRPPFQAATVVATLKQVLDRDPISPRQLDSSIDKDLETICLKALSKEASRRYASADDLAAELRRYLNGEPIKARPVGRLERGVRWCRRNPVPTALVSACLIALATIAGATMVVKQTSRSARQAELSKQFAAALVDPELSQSYLDHMQSLIYELSNLDSEQTDSLNRRLNEALVKRGEQDIHKGRLTEADIADIEASLNLLEQRDSKAASSLRDLLQQRYSQWAEVFRLEPPFGAIGSILGNVLADPAHLARPVLDAADGKPEAGSEGERDHDLLLTHVASGGNVSLEAEFDGDWELADQLGLVLDGDPEQSVLGTHFLFRVSNVALRQAADADRRQSFQRAAELQRSGIIEIRSDGVRVARQEISLAKLVDKPLRFRAVREGNRLSLQINDLEPLKIEQLFFTAARRQGNFGFVWPATAQVTYVRAARRPLVARPVGLEEADQLVAQQQFLPALPLYRDLMLSNSSVEIQREAAVKQGICLQNLRRYDEAEDLLTGLIATANDRWSALATCYLWLQYLEQDRLDEAEQVYVNLASLYRFEELAAQVPAGLRSRILDYYREATSGGYIGARPTPDRLQRIERLVNAYELLDTSPSSMYFARKQLMQAYHWEGRLDEAADVAVDLLQNFAATVDRELLLIEELVWICINAGQFDRARRELERRLFDQNGNLIEERAALLLESARLHAAQGDLEKAKQDTDRLIEGNYPINHWTFIDLASLRGFILLDLGDSEKATKIWQIATEHARKTDNIHFLQSTICGSLSNSFSREDARRTLQGVVEHSANTIVLNFLRSNAVPYDLLHSMLNNMWQTERARAFARRFTYRQVDRSEAANGQLWFAAMELWRQCVLGSEDPQDTLSAEQEQVLWEMTQQLWSQWQDGVLSEAHMLQVALTYNGSTGVFGWAGLVKALRPDLQARMAYVFGCRMKHLGKIAAARQLFDTCLQAAESDALVARLAQRELDQLADGETD